MFSVTVNSPISSNCVTGEKNTTHSIWRSPDLTGSPFLYSSDNDLMAVGCVNVVLRDGDGKTTAGCTSSCNDSVIAKDCSLGINCCKASLFYESFDVYSLSTSAVLSGKELGCAYAFLAYNYTPSYNNISEIININAVGGNGSKYVPLELRWFFPEPVKFRSCSNGTVETSRRNYSYYDCSCAWYEEGNPYLSDGCQVIEECAKCKENCIWIPNSTTDSSTVYGCQNKLPIQLKKLIIGFSTVGGLLSLLVCSFWLYKVFKRRREIKLKKKFFKQNGGLLLQQQISSSKGTVEKTKIFTSDELANATDNFNKN